MNPFLRQVLILLLVCCCVTGNAQRTKLVLKKVDTLGGHLLVAGKKKIAPVQWYNNPMEANDALRQLIPELRENGYLAAAVDTFLLTDSSMEASVYQGTLYQWAKLSFDSIPVALLNQMNIKLRDWEQVTVSPRRLAALSEQVLVYCENNGYPFASTYLREIQDSGDGLTAQFVLDRGDVKRIDSIAIESDVEISRKYLQNYIGIHQGDLYNESQVRLLTKRLLELPFLQPTLPWKMDFTVLKNTLYLYLKEKKSNQLNGLIGLQPNNVETGKFLLTADVLLSLKNALGYGETMAGTYQNLQYKSPRFHLEAGLPYLFGSPVGFDGSFDLFKKDTTFVRTTFEGGLKYQLSASDFFKVGYQSYSNRLINVDTNYVIANKKLPDNVDVSSHGATGSFYLDHTDYVLSPRKGWQIRFTGAGLIRKVKPNDAITGISDGSGFDYTKLYDSANAEKIQYRFVGTAAYYISPLKNLVVKVEYNGGYISGDDLFKNELFQLGGFKLLRGFDEQSIYASQYNIGTLEVRFLLGRNSYFYLFTDASAVEARYNGAARKDNPVSVGGGITLENKSGIFNVALGMGKTSGTDFQFKQTKIHFGYSAYF